MNGVAELDPARHTLQLFNDVKKRLAKAVLLFQDKFVDLHVDSGSLVQVRFLSLCPRIQV